MTAGRPANQIHRLRPNHREWTPPQLITFDTETWPEDTPEGELHTLRCWAARLDVRRAASDKELGTSTGYGFTADELADQFDIWTEGQRCVWAYAHNLSFDLSVTRLPAAMHSRGWQVTGHAVSSDSPWLRMKRGQCVVTFADSWGWLRAPLAQIGADVGFTKPDLPSWGDSDDLWVRRAQGDTEILARAMLALMRWWDTQQLGSWTLTGSAGGWNTWRHRTTVALPLIVPEPDQLAADREAIYGGRREAFAHGEIKGGPFDLLDFKSAYPSVAASHALPAARQGNFTSQPIDSPLVCNDEYGIIAKVRINTDSPRYPVRVNGRIAYPVGEFDTTLAGPEIAEARRLGHLVSIGPGYLHKLSPHMQEWASWVLRVTADDSGEVPAVAKRAVKHWGRAVIGKTAAKGWRTIPLASLGGTGWDYRPAWNAELKAPSHLTDVCGQAAEVVSCGDSENAYPAILAWVESWTRVYLSRVIDAIGRFDAITCDTDGLIIRHRPDWPQLVAHADTGALQLRHKGSYRTVHVLGPQHVLAPGDRKLAGIPRSATEDDSGRLTALLWPKLATQMSLRPGTSDAAYLRPRQTFTLANSYVTGWVDSSGRVHPLRSLICSKGQTHLAPRERNNTEEFPDELQASHLPHMIGTNLPGGKQCSCHTFRSNGTTGGYPQSRPTTSSGSRPSRTPRGAGKLASWRTIGAWSLNAVIRACSGKTRTSSPTQTTSPPCTALSTGAPNLSTSLSTSCGQHPPCVKDGCGRTDDTPTTPPSCPNSCGTPPTGLPSDSPTHPPDCSTSPSPTCSNGNSGKSTAAWPPSPGQTTSPRTRYPKLALSICISIRERMTRHGDQESCKSRHQTTSGRQTQPTPAGDNAVAPLHHVL